jgi:hypothetical protein
MLKVKSEKLVKCFFPKSFLDDLTGVQGLFSISGIFDLRPLLQVAAMIRQTLNG